MEKLNDRIPELLAGGRILGVGGEYIGQVGQIYRDDETDDPTWLSVEAPAGESQPLIPLVDAVVEGDDVQVPYDATTVAGAPRTTVGSPLTPEDEQGLREYYRMSAGPRGDDSPATVVRSEERLRLTTRRVPVRRARLQKFQVTESRTITVPVTRDEVRVVYEEIDDGAEGLPPDEPAAEMRPWVLMEERIVVTKEKVPVETVRLVVESVTEQREITEAVRKEHVTLQTSAADAQDRRTPPTPESADTA